MKIVIAPDSFKGSLTAVQAADIIEAGIKDVCPEAITVKAPMADGGEGTRDVLVKSTGGKTVTAVVKDPLDRDIEAAYGILGDGKTAVIEMAAASGLMLLLENERNPLITTTYGTGQLIKHALDNGCRNFILGIGGSATNDGGVGMAGALGVKFLKSNGESIRFCGGGLKELNSIDLSGLDKRIHQCNFQIACDVNNPLCGLNGAAYVYGPQKGGDETMIKALDENLKHYGKCVERNLGISIINLPGAGAAGGLGGGMVAFLNAELNKGTDIIINELRLEEKLKGADLVITGEGRTDFQTSFGKAPFGVAKLAKKYKVPVIVISGGIEDDNEKLYSLGFDSMFSVVDKPMILSEAIDNSSKLLLRATKRVMRTIIIGSRIKK